MSNDDGGEMMSREVLYLLAQGALTAQGVKPITETDIASLAATGRAIMTYAFRPSPFQN